MENNITEVEKLYRNAGINMCTLEFRTQYTTCDYNTCNGKHGEASCGWYEVPPLAPEKQLELIKWLVQNKRLCVRKAEYSNNFYMDTIMNRSNGVDSKNFEVCLASQVNNLWQNLTEQERTEIRSILE